MEKKVFNIRDLEQYNISTSVGMDPDSGFTTKLNGFKNTELPFASGKDVLNKKINFENKNDESWRRGFSKNPCSLTTYTATKFPGENIENLLAQKKEAIFYPLSENASSAGGLQIIINLATAGAFCGDNYDPSNPETGVFGINKIKVFQI
jgi:hypothetical protein